MFFRQIFDEKLAQYAYLIGCQQTGEALVIDPQRDIDRYIETARAEDLTITAATETHIHADFLSGCREFAEQSTAVYLSDEGGADWKYTWPRLGDYNVALLHDGATFRVGNIEIQALHTPGHTPEHLSFLVTDHGGGADAPMGIASGDFVFVGALGRPDLLETAAGQAGAREPSARTLYQSVQRFLEMDDYLQVWPGHGAGSACGKALGSVPESTVGYEKQFNPSIEVARRGEEAFVGEILDGQPEPPLYFARMKQQNRDGVPLLGERPRPQRLTAEELASLAGRTDLAVVDARTDRSAFMRAHLPGALYAPFDKTFPTIVGSYVAPEQSVYLIIEEGHVEEAMRSLVRVGLDRIEGFAPPERMASVENLAAIEEIDIDGMEVRRTEPTTAVLDVRRRDEHRERHVPDALLAPHVRLAATLDELPRDRTLLVHCRTGARAAAAAALLAREGFDVAYVNGNFSEWEPARRGGSIGLTLDFLLHEDTFLSPERRLPGLQATSSTRSPGCGSA